MFIFRQQTLQSLYLSHTLVNFELIVWQQKKLYLVAFKTETKTFWNIRITKFS